MPRIVKIVLAVIVGIPLLGITAAFCAAGLQRARNSGEEASAIGSLRSIVSGQANLCRQRLQRSITPRH